MGDGVNGARPALAGVRILDFSSLLAGPISPLFLGMLGAEVIKVESRVRLEGMRRPPYAYDDPEQSPVYNSLNLNKLCVQLNLKEPAALELALRLVSVSDAVVENMRPGVIDRMGLGYDRLRQANPTIVMISGSSAVTPFLLYSLPVDSLCSQQGQHLAYLAPCVATNVLQFCNSPIFQIARQPFWGYALKC